MPYNAGDSSIVRFYDDDYDFFRTPSGDRDFYVEEAKRANGPVLELGCGTGRILAPTAAAGVDITGVDLSPGMLARARGKTDAELIEADMCTVDLGRRFALITIPFRAIAHLDDMADHVRLFENVWRHLADDGRLIFDFFQPRMDFLVAPRPWNCSIERTDAEGRRVQRYDKMTPHPWRQVSDIAFRWEVDGVEAGRSEFTMRWFFHYELHHLLARCGLAVEAVCGDFERGPFDENSKEQIFVARRGLQPV